MPIDEYKKKRKEQLVKEKYNAIIEETYLATLLKQRRHDACHRDDARNEVIADDLSADTKQQQNKQ